MEANCPKLTERMLQLTLEIINLLTGEDNIVIIAKKTSGGRNPVTVPLQSLPIPSTNNKQKILDVTKKMIELLMGESVNWSHFNVRIKAEIKEEEEMEYIEGQKDDMMASQSNLTSPDGSSNGNPSERSPCPLYSQDSTLEDLPVPHYQQGKNGFEFKTEIKEEKEEIDVVENQVSMMEAEIMGTTKEESNPGDCTDGPSNGNPRQKCPRPPYSRDSTQEALTIPHHHQGGKKVKIKTEIKEEEEEIYIAQNQMSMMEAGNSVKITKEESTLDDRTEGHNICNTSEGGLILSADHTKEKTAQYSQKVRIVTQNVHSDINDMESLTDGFNSKELKDESHAIIPNVQSSFQGADIPEDPYNSEESSPSSDPDVQKLFSCSQCDMTFLKKSILIQHQMLHIKNPFCCVECGQYFSREEDHQKHMRFHYTEKPYRCSECGKRFTTSSSRKTHMKIHTGEKPFSCSVCGKAFIIKYSRDAHMVVHTGERPYSCSLCGKRYPRKSYRDTHENSCTGSVKNSKKDCRDNPM